MLTICNSSGRKVSRYGRREMLRIGACAIGGMSLSDLGMLQAQAATEGVVRDKSVVVLNMQGGPTQFETFDPKMTAPQEIRSITGEVSTSLPGVTFGGTLPKLAPWADRMAIVRSYRHGISSHGPAAKHVMAGGNSTGAMMGSLFTRVAGISDPSSGMPQNVLVTSRAINSDDKDLYYNAERVSQTGTLPSSYKPFDPSSGGDIIENMRLHVDGSRLDERRHLLARLDQLRRGVDGASEVTALNVFQQNAFDVLVRGVGHAFDLSKEDPALIERYDTSMFAPGSEVQSRNSYASQFSPVALGKQMLLARRLCESGCRFVTVTSPGWDMHGGGKEFTMQDGLASLMPAVDKAVAAFLSDVEERGLSEEILLVITGEFGRTPRINKNGGRDHWGNLCTLAFAGGGLKMGQVVGRSDRIAGEPASDAVESSQVLATILHTLIDVGKLRLLTGVAKDVERVITGSQPIRELV